MRKRSDMRSYQILGYNHVIKNEACALFKDMGLGKTVTTLTAIADLLLWVEVSKVLVISTKQVANNVWSDEVKEWEHLKHLRVMPVNGSEKQRIDKLRKVADIYTMSIDSAVWFITRSGGNFGRFDMVVLDESSLVKNPDTRRFKTLRKAFGKLKRKVLLTGTPTPNGLVDLWSQLFLLDGGARLLPTLGAFRSAYTEPNRSGFGYQVKPEAHPFILNAIGDICLA
jgi:SNF2 family DNA or RNA helicase